MNTPPTQPQDQNQNQNNTTATPSQGGTKSIVASLKGIHKSLSSIHKIVEDQYKLSLIRQKRILDQRKKNDKKDKEQKTETRATPANKKIDRRDITKLVPKLGIIDFLKNFVIYTAFGFVATRLVKYYPQILGTLKILDVAKVTLEFLFGNLFNAVVTSIEIAYKKFDQIRNVIKKIGGEKFVKTFDDLSKKLNIFLNILGIATMLTVSTLLDINKETRTRQRANRKRTSKKTRERYGRRYGEQARTERFGRPGEATRRGGLRGAARGAGRAARGAATSARGAATGMTNLARTGKGLGNVTKKFAKFPIIGPLIVLGLRLADGDNPGRAAVAAIGAGIGQSLGAFSVGAIATVLGGGIASFLTGPIGAILGATVGSMIGEYLGELLYDSVAKMIGLGDNTEKPKIQQKARGGFVGPTKSRTPRGNTSSRTLRQQQEKIKRMQPLKPTAGKQVGGIKQLERIYSNPQDPKTKNQIRMLLKNSNAFNRRKNDTISQIMRIGSDFQHGEKPTRERLGIIATNFGIMVQNLVEDKTARNVARVTNNIFAMADGGYVPATRTLSDKDNIAKEVKKNFELMLNRSVNMLSNDIFTNIKQEMKLRDPVSPGGGGSPEPSGGSGAQGGKGLEEFSEEDLDALGRMIQAEAGNQPEIGKAAVLNVILNRYRAIKMLKIANPSDFSIWNKTRDQVTLRDILFARQRSGTWEFSPMGDGGYNRVSSEQGKNALDQAVKAGGHDPDKFVQNLIRDAGLNPRDADFVMRSVFFSTMGSETGAMVRVHGHVFQHSQTIKIRGNVPAFTEKATPTPVSFNVGPITYGVRALTGGGPNIHARSVGELRRYTKGGRHWDGKKDALDIFLRGPKDETDIPVKSPVAGTIIGIERGGASGHGVVIHSDNPRDHNKKGFVLLCHFKYPVTLRVGSRVSVGQVLGIQGRTGGRVTKSPGAEHVHIEAADHVIDRFIKMYDPRPGLGSQPQRGQRARPRQNPSGPQASAITIKTGESSVAAAPATFSPSQPNTVAGRSVISRPGEEYLNATEITRIQFVFT